MKMQITFLDFSKAQWLQYCGDNKKNEDVSLTVNNTKHINVYSYISYVDFLKMFCNYSLLIHYN